MSLSTPVDHLARALDATGNLIAGVRDDQWTNTTPCPQWNVRTLVNHLVGGNRMFANVLRGEPLPPPDVLQQQRALDHLGDDPIGAYRRSAAELLEAFGRPDVLQGVFRVPAGTLPGPAALHLRITEALVHGWDIARATGQPANVPEDLAEEELSFSSGQHAPDVPRTGHPFGPIQSVDDDAPAIDRLAAYLGRPVGHFAEADRA